MAKLIEVQLKTDAYRCLRDDEEEVLTCSICLQDFGQDDQVTRLNCNDKHIFHKACLQKALEAKLNCPICRKSVLIDHSEQPSTDVSSPSGESADIIR